MAFSPTVAWNTAFLATPAGSDDPRQGDDRIRELKTAVDERLARELFWGLHGGSSAGQEGNLRAGAGRVYHQSSAPTVKPDGNALDADDAGRLYCQSNTTGLRVRTSNSTWVPVALASNDGRTYFEKIIDIGDWNMAATISVAVAHGLTLSKILEIKALLRTDTDNTHVPFSLVADTVASINHTAGLSCDATNVNLRQALTGSWATICSNILGLAGGSGGAGTDWDSTSYNRGWIIIKYLP